MSEKRFDDELEEPGDELEEQAEQADDSHSSDGEPWAKTSSGDADEVVSD